MSPATGDGGLEEPIGDGEFDPAEMDRLFDVLANGERRCVLRSLHDAGGTASFDEVVADVARQTLTRPPTHSDRRRIATSLYHVHLPKLESAELVAGSDPEGDVTLAECVEDVPRTLFESS